MTLREICDKLDLSESSVKTNFTRTQKILLKKNIKLIKNGRGAAATYEIEYLNDNRAMTIYEEVKEDIILSNESMEFPNWKSSFCFRPNPSLSISPSTIMILLSIYLSYFSSK